MDGTEKFAVTIASDAKADQQSHPNEPINKPDFEPRVYFNEMNADSLNIIVIYWYHPPEYWDYLEHAQWINMQIMERFNAEGIDFAFPTQTLHMAGDDKRPLTIAQRWESKEESFSPSAILAQAAALGAQAAQIPASDAVRPKRREPEEPKPRVEGELTDAPLEDDVLQGDGEGANFLVTWKAEQDVNQPIIEAVMLNVYNRQRVVFRCPGKIITEHKD